MIQVIQFLVIGLIQGSFLLIAAIGFSLTRRVEGFLNIAHAELMSISAFTTIYLRNSLGWPFLFAAAVGIGLAAVVGLIVARLFYDPIHQHHGPAVALITSVGVVFVLHGIVEVVIGTGSFLLELPRVAPLRVGSIVLPFYHIMVVLTAIVVIAGLVIFLNHTRIGTAIRVMAINRDLAASRGVSVRKASGASWLVSSALAGVAGVCLAVLGAISADKGFEQILLILAVSLLAGLNSTGTVVASAFLIGISMEMSLLWLPGGFRPLIAFAVVILTLVFLPTGLAGEES